MSPAAAELEPAALPLRSGWAARLNEAWLRLPGRRAADTVDALRAGTLEHGIWIEEQGRRSPIELALRPPLMDLASRGYLHHVAWQIRVGLRQCVRLVAECEQAASLVPLGAAEQEWFERYRRSGTRFGTQRLFCRLDALGSLEGPGWRERLRFVEANVIGIGGITYAPPAERLLLEQVIPRLLADTDDMEFDRNADPAALLLDELTHHARRSGITGAPCIALIDDRSLYTLGGELGRLTPRLRSLGLDVVYADPRELELAANGDIVFSGRRIDVIYRFLELDDLVGLETTGADLSALRAGFARNIVVPGVGGDLEHKSVFELLTNPVFTADFDPELARVLSEHVLWTRLLFERETGGPDGEPVDLVAFTRQHRARLVIKPNRGAGGEGVVIGSAVDDREWDDALGRAMRDPCSHVVQAVAEPVAEAFPVCTDSTIELAPRYTAIGFFPGRTGLGVFGRFSISPVVNIQAGGGIAPFLVSVR